jgi:hypothetical protein
MGPPVGKLLWFVSLALAALAFALVPAATGAELSRREYVTRADAICQVGVDRVKPFIASGFREFKKNEVVRAGAKFAKAAQISDSSHARLLLIPKPPADAADLTTWLKKLKIQNLFLARTGKSLSEGRRVQAQGYLSRYLHNGNLANDIVLGFGFKSCLFHRHVE